MKVLVSGGAGFLGSHLCERLLSRGDRVICVDNFFTGREENIEHLKKNSQFALIEHDICNPLKIEEDLDEIYNLACPASPKHYQRDPLFTLQVCVQGSLNMLNLARQKSAKIMQASTSEVYGDPLVHPQKENYFGNVNPVGIRSCYDEGKRCAEALFCDFMRLHQTEIKIARIFNTYGPRMHADDGRVVSNFIKQALANESLTVYGKGTQTRSFCYVDDLIEGFLCLMQTKKVFTGPVNLGNPGEFTVEQLAHKIIALTDSTSDLIFQSLPHDDPKQRRPDISLASQVLDWKPHISLEAGLEKTIHYFETRIRD